MFEVNNLTNFIIYDVEIYKEKRHRLKLGVHLL